MSDSPFPANESPANESRTDESADKPLNFFQMVHSVGASFFGVQSSENRERDFKRGNARHFIAVAILMTVIWYGAIATLVHFVLPD
jgi:hypothetical protein